MDLYIWINQYEELGKKQLFTLKTFSTFLTGKYKLSWNLFFFMWRKTQTAVCEKLKYLKFPLTSQLAGMWEMEIQSLDLKRSKWVLEPELSKLELYVHFYNCVTRGWFCVTSETRTPDLMGWGGGGGGEGRKPSVGLESFISETPYSLLQKG